jgi:glycogen operon protein
MLATLFASVGTIMLTAGDEFGRSQAGNNNAYAQDNALTWIDWATRDVALEDHVARLSAWRARHHPARVQFPEDGQWLTLSGQAMTAPDWHNREAFVWTAPDGAGFIVDRGATRVSLVMPTETPTPAE